MSTLNSKQTTALAVAGAVCATLLVIHNPFDGYEFTERYSGGESRFKAEWQFSRPDCTKDLQAEMLSINQHINESNMSAFEKAVAKMTGKSAQISQQCVQVTTLNEPIEIESEPLWVWKSKGALHPRLATVRGLLVSFALVGLWTSIFVFAFREKATAESPSP